MQKCPPPYIPPRHHLISNIPHHRHCFLVGCCFYFLICSHLRLWLCPSLYFLMGRVSTPKANPTAQNKTNRAYPVSPMMWGARASCRGPNTAGGRTMVQHRGGPTTDPTINPPPPKISLILASSADSGPSVLTIASQQCGASEDARGWLASNRKQTYQVGFGWWSNHPPYHTKIHPTQPPHNHLQASRCRPFWTTPRHPSYAYGASRPPMRGGDHMMMTRG
jgi:hypothetical protein